MIIEAEKHFMQLIETMEPPAIGGNAADTTYIAEAFPISNGEEDTMPDSLEQLALEYNELNEQAKQTKARMEEIKNTIRLEAKEIERLKGRNVVINMPTINKTLFDSAAFKKEHGDLYDQFKTKTSTYRDFKIKLLEA